MHPILKSYYIALIYLDLCWYFSNIVTRAYVYIIIMGYKSILYNDAIQK